jgi:hypothetical protein
MGRLTLRLPGTLHDQLADLAQREGVSLNQYIVYALTRQVTLTYTVQTLPEQAVAEQRASFKALLQGLGRASDEQIKAALDEREVVEPEDGLSPEVVTHLRERLAPQT